jgi:hypothetical protein
LALFYLTNISDIDWGYVGTGMSYTQRMEHEEHTTCSEKERTHWNY